MAQDRKDYFRQWQKNNRERLNEQARKRYAADPEKHRERTRKYLSAAPERRRAVQLKHKYGLSLEEFSRMVEEQNGRCAVCDEPFTKTPRVDHNHNTGAVRGLLCTHCNTALGSLRESPIILARAINYLEKWNAQN